MLFSRAGRDDADDFFATNVLPLHVNNQQHSASAGLYQCRANRMPSLLHGLVVDALRVDQAALVLKDQRRQFK
jgi:hypothetical protein